MHDGYIFSLGICGSANDSGLTPACLDTLLGAIPPVKRAALLGEVLVSLGMPDLHDPLIAPILADIADAEILLIVTPIAGGGLPARLRGLFQAVAANPPPTHPRFAALVFVGANDTTALATLHRFCAVVQATIMGELWLADGRALDATTQQQLVALAQSTYAAARRDTPTALPL